MKPVAYSRLATLGLVTAVFFILQAVALQISSLDHGLNNPRSLEMTNHLVAYARTIIQAILLPRSNSPATTAGWGVYPLVYLSASASAIGISGLLSIVDHLSLIAFMGMDLGPFTIAAHTPTHVSKPSMGTRNIISGV